MTLSAGRPPKSPDGLWPAGRRPTHALPTRPVIAWALARLVLTAQFCASGLVVLLEVYQIETAVLPTVVAAILLTALLAIQLGHFSRPGANLHSPRSYVLLALLAGLAFVPYLEYGWTWLGLPPFLAGCLLLVLPAPISWGSFAAVMLSVLAIRTALDQTPLAVAYGVTDAVVFGLSVYLLTILARTVASLHAARHGLAAMVVAEERLRFARDLHGLLGLSLSTVALKGELTHRLLVKYPERAKRELSEILVILRRALADVRSVASGYRELSLDQEARSAEAGLAAFDITVRMELDYRQDLPKHVRGILSALLREGVTNVLQHSVATHCEITIRQSDAVVTLSIVNDGVEQSQQGSQHPHGLHGLSEQVAALHGEVRLGREQDRFRLHATVPIDGVAEPEPGPAARASAVESVPIGKRASTLLVITVFCSIYVAAVVHQVMVGTGVAPIVWGACYLTALLALQLAVLSGRVPVPRGSLRAYLFLAAQACLVYVPLMQLGALNWISVPGWLAGNALLWLPRAEGWMVFTASIGTTIWVRAAADAEMVDITFQAAATIITGLVAFGLASLSSLIEQLRATRAELARRAVAEERLRFARDLHDMLGLSLSAITLKCELVNRLLAVGGARVADELADVLALTRQALVDVRAVASGDQVLSLDQETELAEAVLTAADVDVRMELVYQDLPVVVSTVLAVVLREGVTNVLRHSKAEHCEIAIRQEADRVSMDIVNDGAVTQRDRNQGGVPSSGTRNLSERVRKLGGEFTHGSDGDSRYRVRADLPL